jgi:hypothetical protein
MAGSRDDEDDLPPGEGGGLSEEITRRWDPSRLLKLVSMRAGRGQSLDAMTRAKYERKLGVDLGGVRVYTGEFAERVTKAHRAEAVTVGSTGMILMSGTPGRSPLTASRRGLLAHELTHVAQAKRGLHRAAVDKPLATEQHEVEAEQAEAEEMALEEPEAQAPGGLTAEQREALFARVLEMLEEEERLFVDRNGLPPSRP